ncbi:MAG: hypothetical protein KGZ69_00830 [Methylomonas sp.]|nr:hypothetical protein [Methylomonas sp.]
MTYSLNVHSAAHRHLLAANILYDEGSRRDVAGYLYGIAAECAIKAMMIDAGQRPIENRKDDPFFAHFPQLRTMLRDRQIGRRGTILRRFIENDHFFSQWDTKMRYCKGTEIEDKWIVNWKDQACDAVACIGT